MSEEGKKKKAEVDKEEIAHESSDVATATTPDVCKTPTPGGPIPIPYPNVAKSSDTSGSKKVKVEGKEAMTKIKSDFSMSEGDEPSQSSGIISSLKRTTKTRKLGLPVWIWIILFIAVISIVWILAGRTPELIPEPITEQPFS